MWAQRLIRPGVFEPVEVAAPDPARLKVGETLLRVEAGAICGSDLPYFAGEVCTHFADESPLAANIIGFPLHEVVGEVIATDDPALPIGRRAVGWATGFSALAELAVTDSDSLMAVPGDLSPAVALTLQPLACVLRAVGELGDLHGQRIAVLGLGPFGLLFAHALATSGASHVIGVDRVDRSDVARDFMVDEFVHSATRRWARGLADTHRPNVVVEAIGHQVSTLADALEAVADRGRIFCFGVPDEEVYPLPMQVLFRKHASTTGGIANERRQCLTLALAYLRCYPELHDLLVTHSFDFADAQHAFELASRPTPGRLKVQLVR